MRQILKQAAPELLALLDAVEETQIDVGTLLKGLYLIKNTQRFTRYGNVTFLIQDGQIVRVEQKQGFKIDV